MTLCQIGWSSASIVTYPHSLTHSLILQKSGFTSNYTGSSGHKNDSNDTFHSLQFTVPKFTTRKPCPVLRYPTISLLTWYQMISWSLTLNKCHGDINLDEVLEVKDKACRLWLRWRTTFTTTPPNNNIGRSNTGKLNGYLGIKSNSYASLPHRTMDTKQTDTFRDNWCRLFTRSILLAGHTIRRPTIHFCIYWKYHWILVSLYVP